MVPDQDISEMITKVGADEPVVITFPEILDTGSIDNGDTTGLVSCGARTYTLTDGGSFLYQLERDVYLFTEDPNDAGEHTAKMVVTLQDYPEVEALVVEIPVFIEACEILELVDSTKTFISPLNRIIEFPVDQFFAMPLYEPVPACGLTSADVSYQLMTDSGQPTPSWIEIDPGNHQIKVDIEEGDGLYGETFNFKLVAMFTGMPDQEQNF